MALSNIVRQFIYFKWGKKHQMEQTLIFMYDKFDSTAAPALNLEDTEHLLLLCISQYCISFSLKQTTTPLFD